MRIIIICGCLEPGKDGVGDYVRILAKELFLLGVKPFLLAVNDHYISSEEMDHGEMQSYRLPANQDWREKMANSKKWINKIHPQHIVWQFVIYAYHPRGLAFWPIYLLKNLLYKYSKVSIMFHELWIGAAKEDRLIDKFTGEIQRLLIKWLVRELNPETVFTSNTTFINLLKNQGIESNLLPVFSNIPFVSGAKLEFIQDLKRQNADIPEGALKLGLFGRIPYSWEKKKFIDQVKKISEAIPVVLFIAGKSDRSTAEEIAVFGANYLPSLKIVSLGEMSVPMISGFLQYVDFGITMNAPQTIGKSGVFAAYTEHGLPVIKAGFNREYSSNDETTENTVDHPIVELNEMFFEKLKTARKLHPKNTRTEVANKFLGIVRLQEKKLSLDFETKLKTRPV